MPDEYPLIKKGGYPETMQLHRHFRKVDQKLTPMFGLFKKKSEKEKLQAQYEKLMQESHQLSHSNRRAADEKYAEADAVAKKIEALNNA